MKNLEIINQFLFTEVKTGLKMDGFSKEKFLIPRT